MNNQTLDSTQEITNPIQLDSVDYIAAIPHETSNYETSPDFANNWWYLKREWPSTVWFRPWSGPETSTRPNNFGLVLPRPKIYFFLVWNIYFKIF